MLAPRRQRCSSKPKNILMQLLPSASSLGPNAHSTGVYGTPRGGTKSGPGPCRSPRPFVWQPPAG